MTIISKHASSKTLFRSGIRFICFWFGHTHDVLPVFAYFLTNFGQMTLTFRVGRSRSFENCIKSCGEVSSFDITRFGTSFHRKTNKNSDIISDPIYSKSVTFDL